MSAHRWRLSSTACILLSLPLWIFINTVHSSAYLHTRTWSRSSFGIASSMSSMWILKRWGEITQPCGTPAGHGLIVDTVIGSFTCWVRELRKLWIQSHKLLLMFLAFSFDSRIEWSTRSKALWKSRNSAWMPFLPVVLLSVSLNQLCVMLIRADTVERPWVKACWFPVTVRADLFRDICTFSRTLPRTGITDICRKSFSMSSGGWILGIGLTSACL